MKKPVLFIFCFLFLLSPAFLSAGSNKEKQPAAPAPAISLPSTGGGLLSPEGGGFPTVTGGNPFSEPQESTLEDEYYLGRAVAANILSIYKPYTQNAKLTAYLNSILKTIVINSDKPVIFNGYHLMILDSNEFNAFATPGGHIFVTRALVSAAPSEDALAAVIAHELAHIMLRHSMVMIDSLRVEDELSAIGQRASAIAGGPQIAAFRQTITNTVDTMVKNGYSRAQELEADNMAVVLLAQSGYDPGGLLEILKVLETIQRGQNGGFNTTHPSPSERIANVSALRFRASETRPSRVSRFNNK